MKKQVASTAKSPTKKAASPANDYVVFVSHATYDKWIAQVICEKIESLGVKTWRDDRDIDGGDKIPEAVRRAIASCSEVAVLLTPKSVDRPWILLEVGMAIGQEKRIVPLFYHVEPAGTPAVTQDNRGFHLHELDRYLSNLKTRSRGE